MFGKWRSFIVSLILVMVIMPVLLWAEEAGASEPVKGIGSMLLGLNSLVGGGLLAIIVKFLIDLIKKFIPKSNLIKRFFPVIAPAVAMIIWSIWEVLTTGVDIVSIIQMGLIGGLGATGLHEIVNTAIMGNVSKTLIASTPESKPTS